MSASSENNYRNIIKGISIFGGVQIFQILINILRGKIIAIFLGPDGMGISGLLTSSLAIIITLVGCGINTPVVAFLSKNNDSNDLPKYEKQTKIIYLLLSLIGLLVTIGLSFFLSNFNFKSNDYVFSYCILGFYVFFSVFNTGLNAILQAKRKMSLIALGNFLPSLVGLLVTFPLYYFFGVNAIAPGIVVVPLFTFIFFSCVLKFDFKTQIDFKDLPDTFKRYFTLGIFLICGGLVANLVSYLLNTFISRVGNMADIGLYNAAISISNQYIGVVFAAMAVDYFPRLSKKINDKVETCKLVNSQSYVVSLIISPLLAIMIVSAPIIIRILLSEEFLPVCTFIRIVTLGMLFKSFSYPFGYICLAKNDKKLFFLLEVVIGNVQNIILNMLGYYIGGLLGLSISFLISYILYFIEILLVVKIRYKYYIESKLKTFYLIFSCILTILCLLTYINNMIVLIACILIVLGLSIFSLLELNKMMNLVNCIKNKFMRKNVNE